MIVDLRRQHTNNLLPIHINSIEVEQVSNFKFLSVHIIEDLSWTLHTDTVVKKARQRLYFLRKLKKFGVNADILRNFYRSTIESLLTGCIMVWCGNCTSPAEKHYGGASSKGHHWQQPLPHPWHLLQQEPAQGTQHHEEPHSSSKKDSSNSYPLADDTGACRHVWRHSNAPVTHTLSGFWTPNSNFNNQCWTRVTIYVQ